MDVISIILDVVGCAKLQQKRFFVQLLLSKNEIVVQVNVNLNFMYGENITPKIPESITIERFLPPVGLISPPVFFLLHNRFTVSIINHVYRFY